MLHGFVFTCGLAGIGSYLGAPTGHELGGLTAVSLGEEGHVVRRRFAMQQRLIVRIGDGEEHDGAIHRAGIPLRGIYHIVILKHLLQVAEAADDE